MPIISPSVRKTGYFLRSISPYLTSSFFFPFLPSYTWTIYSGSRNFHSNSHGMNLHISISTLASRFKNSRQEALRDLIVGIFSSLLKEYLCESFSEYVLVSTYLFDINRTNVCSSSYSGSSSS